MRSLFKYGNTVLASSFLSRTNQVCISGWIIHGHFGKLNNTPREELYACYDRACKLIELGRQEWPDVPRQVRGTTFDLTFLRGVKTIRMDEYMKVCIVIICMFYFRLVLIFSIRLLRSNISVNLENSPWMA